jgi:phosphoglycerate dehydrogenase-like enzyme
MHQKGNIGEDKINIAILDDYQNVALDFGGWANLPSNTSITVFNIGIEDESDLVTKLLPFNILVTMRERTWLTKSILERLTNLRLIAATGGRQLNIDIEAATNLGITICNTGSPGHSTAELTWGLILSLTRSIALEDKKLREGIWQTSIGVGLDGKKLGLIGLGRVGKDVAKVAPLFDMELLVWSPNMTQERADEYQAKSVSKDTLLSDSDIISIHIPLNASSKGIIQKKELSLMKSNAYLINTSRGPIVNENALIEALQTQMIAGAALDVFDEEPLEKNHPFLSLENTLLTPHLGYVTAENYDIFYGESVENIQAYLKGNPINVLNPDSL